jgi:hypothetical protein
MSQEDGVGPLDFLYCEKCEEHIKSAPLFAYEMDHLVVPPMTTEERQRRIAPEIAFKIKPLCPVCEGPLIQKYVSVTVNIDLNEEES